MLVLVFCVLFGFDFGFGFGFDFGFDSGFDFGVFFLCFAFAYVCFFVHVCFQKQNADAGGDDGEEATRASEKEPDTRDGGDQNAKYADAYSRPSLQCSNRSWGSQAGVRSER